jgi:ADP-heptose:LPS heptosyltransferase
VSLQYTDGSQDEIDSVNRLGYKITEPPQAKAKDYQEAAQLVASCDLVITVCTSVVHLAGALGVPCWVMVPKHPAWRYQTSGVMPWYRSVRLYRQPTQETDSWIPVVQRVGLDLDELVHGKKQAAA